MRPSPTLLRACGRGNQAACDIAKKLKVMYAASVLTFANVNEKSDNPNHLPFTGTLLLVDVASDKPPHGSEGHRIFVSSHAAKKAIVDLPGQAVNYQPDGLNAHASRHKVGVITKAWMEGSKVKVSGFIWVHDFPEARVLKNRSDLGMSMELANVYVKDENADVWNLEKFDFTGGTILKKSAAAYTKTDLAAVAAAAEERKGETMKHGDKKDKHQRKVAAADHKDTGQRDGTLALMATAITGSLGPALSNAMGPVITELKASGQRFEEGLEEIRGHLYTMQAAADRDEDEDDDEIVVHAARHDASTSASASEEEEAEEMEASASSSGSASVAAARKKGGDADEDWGGDDDDSSSSASDSDMEAMEDMGLEDASEEPGEVNKGKGDKNKGSKTTVTDPPTQGEHFKGNVAKGRLHSAADERGGKVKKTRHVTTSSIQAAALIGDLQASVRQLRRQVKAQGAEHTAVVHKLRKRLQRVQAQATRFAELEGRHSRMSNELVNLGEKVGVDFNEARVGGQKFSVRAFDSILAAAEQSGVILNPQQRITMKMLAEQEGLLDEGVVDRMGRA